MKALVALPNTSRLPQPAIGSFRYSNEHDCYLWEGKTASNLKEFSDQVNVALEELHKLDNPYLRLTTRVIAEPKKKPKPTPDPDSPKGLLRIKPTLEKQKQPEDPNE